MAQICGEGTSVRRFSFPAMNARSSLEPSIPKRLRPCVRPSEVSTCHRISTLRAVPLQCRSVIRCSAADSSRRRRPDYVPNRIDDPSYVRILDTTLRDGEQSPGAAMTSQQKLELAEQLAKLGVDVIEAGFPIASSGDLEAVKLISKEVGNRVDEDGYVPVICGVARCNKLDIDAAWEAVRYAMRPRIGTFIATSDIHLRYKLKKTREEVIDIATQMVAYARSLGCHDVGFAPEDAARSDRAFLYKVLQEVIKAGATTLTITDTVGYTLPNEFGKLIADIKANTQGIENVIISTHCHNDLGLSTANTLAGAYAGARQLELTVNGIGERAGNASLEEVVMAIRSRGEDELGGLYTGINTRQIAIASKMVSDFTGISVQPHKAIVGANVFAHESGIHQSISNEDLEALMSNELFQPQVSWSIVDMQVTCGALGLSTGTVKLIGPDEQEHVACAIGMGPVHAVYMAIDSIVKIPVSLLEYSLTAVTEGIDAMVCTRVLIRGEQDHSSTHVLTGEAIPRTFSGAGSGMDIVVSSGQAYISALNKMLGFRIALIEKTSIKVPSVSA